MRAGGGLCGLGRLIGSILLILLLVVCGFWLVLGVWSCGFIVCDVSGGEEIWGDTLDTYPWFLLPLRYCEEDVDMDGRPGRWGTCTTYER